MKTKNSSRDYDFTLVIDGVRELTSNIENALYEAGCDDATFGLQYGRLYGEFSRRASSLKEAILSAVQNISKAKIGATVVRVDECSLVTQSDIARRIHRSRQVVHQYITGVRGPGNFPPPICHLVEGAPLWSWCAVTHWLVENSILRPEDAENAEVVAAINHSLETSIHRARHRKLMEEIARAVGSSARAS